MNGQYGTCRGCGARVIWIRTKNGKNMPVDDHILNFRKPNTGEKATDKLVTPEGEVVSAIVGRGDEFPEMGYISHFATCPRR